ncbi:DUF6678 family protein [Singulisphaera acidiphila]|nr:DUF6678 family protein [Singulisphaera acidiphila]
MNNTKWDELRLAMYGLGNLSPSWSTKDLSGYICPYDKDWFYHFRNGGYDSIEWVHIRLDSPEQDRAVEMALRRVHVPGHRVEGGFRVYGYTQAAATIDYI